MGLDQSDPVMRRRLIQSMKFLAEDEAGSTDATQEQLQTVLDKYPEAFQIKPTVSFEHVYFQKGNDDDSQVSAAHKRSRAVQACRVEILLSTVVNLTGWCVLVSRHSSASLSLILFLSWNRIPGWVPFVRALDSIWFVLEQ